MNLRRVLGSSARSAATAKSSVVRAASAVLLALALGSLSTPLSAGAAAPVTLAVTTDVDAVPAGGQARVSVLVDGARPTDELVLGRRSDQTWVDVEREPVGLQQQHAFVVSPPVLGPNVFRVALVRGNRVLTTSAAIRLTGRPAVAPEPVVAGDRAVITGTLPTPVSRPVLLQGWCDDNWRTLARGTSGEAGEVSIEWRPEATTRVRVVAPARSLDGVVYPRWVSPEATVTVAERSVGASVLRIRPGIAGGPSISADGRLIAYSAFSGRVPADADPNVAYFLSTLYLWDRTSGRTVEIMRGQGDTDPNGVSDTFALSGDGRHLVLFSNASNLVDGDDDGTGWDLYSWDDGEIHRLVNLSRNATVGTRVYVSADGRYVGFSSDDPTLVPGDDNGVLDAFVLDRDTGALTRVLGDDVDVRATSSNVLQGLSDDGSTALIATRQRLAGDVLGSGQLYRVDRDHATAESVVALQPGEEVGASRLSPDGRLVGYQVSTDMLVGAAWILDTRTGDRQRVEPALDDGSDRQLARVEDISADDHYALVSRNTRGGRNDLYRYDLRSGEFELITTSYPNQDPQVTLTYAMTGRLSADGGSAAIQASDDQPVQATIWLWRAG